MPAVGVPGRLGLVIRERVRVSGCVLLPTGCRAGMSFFLSRRSGGVSLADSFPRVAARCDPYPTADSRPGSVAIPGTARVGFLVLPECRGGLRFFAVLRTGCRGVTRHPRMGAAGLARVSMLLVSPVEPN